MIPELFVEGWLPGTKDTDMVSIMKREGQTAHSLFLLNVPLKQARLIVAAFDLLRETAGRIKSLEYLS